MDSKAIIDSYVSDVVRRLPRKQRNDVGYELRSLLGEEVDGRAGGEGRPADAASTLEFLAGFGHPEEVADRYRMSGFTVIRAADAPRFAWLALGGVLLQWALTLPAVLLPWPPVDVWSRLGSWWLSSGLGAFWWPGVLVTSAFIAATLGRRDAKTWKPARVRDRDEIDAAAIALALSSGVAGATALIALPWLPDLAPGLPQPMLDAFALNQEFLRTRAPWVVLLWAASFALYVLLLRAGRWSRSLHRMDLVLDLAWVVMLAWWVASGPIFQAAPTDGFTKLCLLVIAVSMVVGVVLTLRRTSTRRELQPPAVLPAQ